MNKAVFLARDGVISEAILGHNNLINDVNLLPLAAESIRILNDLKYKVIVMTYPDYRSLGSMNEQIVNERHSKLLEQLLEEAAVLVDEVFYCPHLPNTACNCRLSKIMELARKYSIDLQLSFTIGENGADIVAGRLAGTRTLLVIDKDEIIPVVDVDNVVFSLQEAVAWILETAEIPEPSFR